ncbi:dentin sialophosphoprotein-like isoform X2 [Diorhabda carinulata]|uniref:dentin sialophosphoprotein-like isoform X2 n=1 Tax=Diorhabda carinulata TaxID=1163345 RepID=UPI0025A1E109|nr:dentin sialophosphoprotein-like isoform X2 [Diorhabda carinulata]
MCGFIDNADSSHKMDPKPKEDILSHESHNLNPGNSEQKPDFQESIEVLEETVAVYTETQRQSVDSERQYINTYNTREFYEGLSDCSVAEESFESNFSIKNKNLEFIIQTDRRPSSLTSLCDRINLLNLQDEDSFESNTDGKISEDNKYEDNEEYFPAYIINSEESSGEFLPAVSTVKFDETSEETNSTKCEDSEQQISSKGSNINLDDSSAKDSYLIKDLNIKNSETIKKFEENASVADNINELTKKIESTEDALTDQSVKAPELFKADGIKTVDSGNQISSDKEFSDEIKSAVDSTGNIECASKQKLDKTININESGEKLVKVQAKKNIEETSPGLSIEPDSIKINLKESEELNFIESEKIHDIEADTTKTPEASPYKLLSISVNVSPNELEKTTSCLLEDDLSYHDSSGEPKDSDSADLSFKCSSATQISSSGVSSNGETDNLGPTFVAETDSSASFTSFSDTIPIKIDDQSPNTTFNSNNKCVSITGSPKAAVPECLNTEDRDKATSEVLVETNSEKSTKCTQIAIFSQGTNTEDSTNSPNIITVSQSTNTDDSSNSPNIITVSQSTNTDDNINSESEDTFGPDSNSNFKMSDMVEKLNQQQAEISDLKLKLNAAQQHNASLELQIRQNEEIVIKAQAEAIRTEQTYQQEVKQLKQKINENSKIIEKDRIQELEEQLKEAKAREAKLLAELSQKTKDDVNYQKIMNQYEITLKNRIAELKKLQEEHDTTRTHLTNLELAFSDVHSKYEKTKAALLGVKANEESLLHNLEVAQSTNIQHEERYESLKAHARIQIEKSNKEIHDAKEQHEQEISKLKAFVRRLEIKVSSLEVSLKQKSAECEQLSNLCDEVTGKKV